MRRFQVKAADKEWTDPGPDLLRKADSAVRQATSILKRGVVYEARILHGKNDPPAVWKVIGKRARVRSWLSTAIAVLHAGDRIQLADERDGKREVRVTLRSTAVEVEHLNEATAGAELFNALIATAFPGSIYSGCFACKDAQEHSPPWPGVTPSDHAWGDAIDRTSSPSAPNDAMTDWAARMARDGAFECAYILGSKEGTVVASERRLIGSWSLKPTNASSSHLWHVHTSIHRHSGMPPCAS